MPLRGRAWSFYEFLVLQCCNRECMAAFGWMVSILNPTGGSNGLANCFSLKPLLYKRLSKIEDALHYFKYVATSSCQPYVMSSWRP